MSDGGRDVWNANSLVLGKEGNPRNCCDISTANLQTPQTRSLIDDQAKKGKLAVCQHRYMIQTKALEESFVTCSLGYGFLDLQHVFRSDDGIYAAVRCRSARRDGVLEMECLQRHWPPWNSMCRGSIVFR